MARVSLLQCALYDEIPLKKIVIEGLENIGFDLKLLNGKRVALKPNLLMPSAVEKAIVTHPVFFKVVAQFVIDYGGIPVLAESPAVNSLESVAKRVGYLDIVQELGIEKADMGELITLRNETAKTFKRMEIAKAFSDVDLIFSLPKFKTHGLTYISGAVKNLLGTIPGLRKSQMHLRCPQNGEFSEMLLDLYGALVYGFEKPKPIITIMDSIVGQEGEGPGPSGTPRQIGVVIIGQDPVAVDYVATCVAGLDHRKVFTITKGFKRDFSISSPDEIEVVGAAVDAVRLSNFTPTRSSIFSHVLRGPLVGPFIKNLLMEKPLPQGDRCTLCYQCRAICPAGAISIARPGHKMPEYDYLKCIRCFCCIEICPEAAISLKKGLLNRLLM